MKLSFDLHIHSALSPCGDESMTPNNIINMAFIKGLKIIALTDHNSMLNGKPTMELGKKQGILVIPGIEVTTKEEVHVLCYFKNIEEGLAFSDLVYRNLVDIRNEKEVFGRQVILDEEDRIIGEVDKLLINSTNYSIKEINEMVHFYNGVMIPAHIDRKSFGILSVLGFIPYELGIKTVEVARTLNSAAVPQHFMSESFNIIKTSYIIINMVLNPE